MDILLHSSFVALFLFHLHTVFVQPPAFYQFTYIKDDVYRSVVTSIYSVFASLIKFQGRLSLKFVAWTPSYMGDGEGL